MISSCKRIPALSVPRKLGQRHFRTSLSYREETEQNKESANDFILSILQASPSARDSRSYLASFGLQVKDSNQAAFATQIPPKLGYDSIGPPHDVTQVRHQEIAALLDPVHRHTALIKIQGPFTELQLESIARGIIYLTKLGLVGVIVVERDDWEPGSEHEKKEALEMVENVVESLEKQGARARPIAQSLARLGPKPSEATLEAEQQSKDAMVEPPEAHVLPEDLRPISHALRAGEIPVLAPFAIDTHCRTVRIDANYLMSALARGMVETSELDASSASKAGTGSVDLTPFRLMIINREGGIPSYARSGLPHLLINLASESKHIESTFQPEWQKSHPSALANLRLAQSCLTYMPTSSSAVIVSHRSPRSLIANLITNKPAHSSSLPHALLSGPKRVTPHTPTIIRYGLPLRVIRSAEDLDQSKMTSLLEQSFRRTLNAELFYERLSKTLDFVIVAGDYAGAAIVTKESDELDPSDPVTYLDKFAVLPKHQGDGTVDFLWVAVHDESYGLGLASAQNPTPGGLQGRGVGRDLVWRSRSHNPVNKWYFERSSGHVRIGTEKNWTMFWCDAEHRLAKMEAQLKQTAVSAWEQRQNCGAVSINHPNGKTRWGVEGLSFVESPEAGRTERWARIVDAVPSSWHPQM